MTEKIDYAALALAQKFTDKSGRDMKAVTQCKLNFPQFDYSSHHCTGCFYYENGIICDDQLAENANCGTTVVFVEDK